MLSSFKPESLINLKIQVGNKKCGVRNVLSWLIVVFGHHSFLHHCETPSVKIRQKIW